MPLTVYNFIGLISLLLASALLVRSLRPAGIAETAVTFFTVLAAQVVGLGWLLSALNHMGEISAWAMAGLVALLVSAGVAAGQLGPQNAFTLPRLSALQETLRAVAAGYGRLTRFEKGLLTPLVITLALVGAMNAVVVAFTAPHNWDSLAYHLPRAAYYAQHQNLSFFEANYWAQVIHPTVAPVLLLWTYLVTGRNENLLQLVQFASYWAATLSVYGSARRLGYRQAASLFAGAVSGLLVEWLMQATTAQNDLILTAFVGASVYFLLAYRAAPRRRYLGLAAVSMALGIGTKASAPLPLLSVALVGLWALYVANRTWAVRARSLAVLAASLAVMVGLTLVNAGYFDNLRQFESFLGPDAVVREVSFEGQPLGDVLQIATKNLARYGLEFVALDGLPPLGPVPAMQSALRYLPARAIAAAGVDLEVPYGTRVPFHYDKQPAAHEDFSYWGVLGFGLAWIVVLLAAAGLVRGPGLRPLAWAALLFVVTQAFAGPYDPWRGRYFTTAAIFAGPPVAAVFGARPRWARAYLLIVALVGCASAILGVALRDDTSWVSVKTDTYQRNSIFSMSRMEQMLQTRRNLLEPLSQFDEQVPADARVAVYLPENAFEFPLFGMGLTRRLYPIHSFLGGSQPIPPDANYLLYAGDYYNCPATSDQDLGGGLFLRQLTATNRTCP